MPARGAAIGQGAELLGQRRYRSRGASYGAGRRSSSPRPVARGTGPETGDGVDRIADLADLRNWRTGLHGGSRRVVEGRIDPAIVE